MKKLFGLVLMSPMIFLIAKIFTAEMFFAAVVVIALGTAFIFGFFLLFDTSSKYKQDVNGYWKEL